MTRTTALVAALAAVLLAGFATDSSAQGVQTGTIRGTVTDQQNLPVPGVNITIQSPALQGVRSTLTGTDGTYSFRQLPPGRYDMRFEIASFAPVTRTTDLLLGLAVEQNVTLLPAGRTEEVQVIGAAPAPIVNPVVGLNIKHEEVQALPTSRTLFGIATLSPGLNENTPNTGQVAINGAMAWDNIFMVNGVDVNDNLFGSPQGLFIEDAIEETQVLTSGITAEYGRFTGGVVNAITKSGGNNFSGSYRLNLTNPSWIAQTPFEVKNGTTHKDILNKTHEATLGGPLVRDRLWFFGAGRLAKQENAATLRETAIGVTQVDDNKRGELKLTGTIATNHTIQGGYLNNSRSVTNTSGLFAYLIEPHSLITRTLPNWYYFTNYRGVLQHNLLAELQYSQRRFEFQGDGGTSTNIIDSPIYSGATNTVYNAPYFDATDPEQRNNRQFTGSVTSFVDRGGRHEFKAGYEFFRSQRTGGNSQSATGYVFEADYVVDAAGKPVMDSNGYPIPIWVPGETVLENWLPVRGAVLNINNNSIYVQDHWTVNRNVSADLGLRFERVRSAATGDIIGVDTDTIVPRLGLAYDPKGDGQLVFHVTYGHYSGRYNETQAGANSNVGNPDVLYGIYTGPAGTGRAFAPALNTANYRTVAGQFPTANISIAEGMSSPVTKEFTVSGGGTMGRAWAEASIVYRKTDNFIDDFITIANGTKHVVKNGVDAGEFTNIVWDNSDLAERTYSALVLQGRYNAMRSLTLYGNWTVELKNDGNFEGEGTNTPGAPSIIGDYPEAFNAARNYPFGRLNNFERSRARIWAIYNLGLGRAGSATVSGIMRAESPQSYSLRALSQVLTPVQNARLEAAGYPDAPSTQTVYFSKRGSELFAGYTVFDLALGYDIPVFRQARPYFKIDIFNLFNNDKLVAWNTTVRQDRASPVDALGLSTGYIKGASFGQGTSNAHYPQSIVGTGLRGFRMAIGLRF